MSLYLPSLHSATCMDAAQHCSPIKFYFFFSQDPVPYSVQRTHDTQADNEDVVINKAVFIWSELNIKPQIWQEAQSVYS